MRLSRLLTFSALMGLAAGGSALAQPYPPGYDRGPPRGFHCESFFRTPDGPRRRFCEIGRPQELGSFCECEAPPGFPPTRGHVVR
jgi:hypothetical protein